MKGLGAFTTCHIASVRRFSWHENTLLLPCCLTWPELFFWHDKTLLSVSQNWFKKKKISIHSHLFLHKGCQSLFKMMLAAVTPPHQPDRALRFHTESVRKDESQAHLSCIWVVLSLRGTGNVSCDIWPHHLELLAPSERTQDLSPLMSQHPLMPHQAGLVSLLQASCDRQPVQGKITKN